MHVQESSSHLQRNYICIIGSMTSRKSIFLNLYIYGVYIYTLLPNSLIPPPTILQPHCFVLNYSLDVNQVTSFESRGINLAVLWVYNINCNHPIMEFLHGLVHLLVKLRCQCMRFANCMQDQIMLVAPNGPSKKTYMVEQNVEANACKSCNELLSSSGERVVCGAHDVEMVMMKLGLWNSEEETDEECGGKCKDCMLMDEACILLEEKEANLEELVEAFAVFDENGDGLISAKELRSVMQKLGFEEGKELEDCGKMLRAYDEDGDGKINFKEFKKMLEFAV